MAVWKLKMQASAIHFAVSCVVALCAGYVVFYQWFPGPLADLLQGTQLFTLLILVELSLGPLVSLVIYNPKKSTKELISDYLLVAIIQLSALAYGLYAVALSRPVFEVFVRDRWELVVPAQITKEDLHMAESYNAFSLFGVVQVCTDRPSTSSERSDLLADSLAGRDIQFQPRFYRACKSDEIQKAAYGKNEFESLSGKPVSSLPEKYWHTPFSWLPVVSRFGAATIVYPEADVSKGEYVALDPFR